jgi:hypothetical protein
MSIHRDGLECLSRMARLIEMARMPYPAAAPLLDPAARQLLDDRSSPPITAALLPDVRIIRAAAYHSARLRIARIGLAALEHRARAGSWPPSLVDLAPAFPGGVPRDPTSGAAFRLEREGEALRISAALDPLAPATGEGRSASKAGAHGPSWKLE